MNLQQKRQIACVVLAAASLILFFVLANVLETRSQIENGIVRGTVQDDVYEDTFVVELEDGSEHSVDIKVYPRQISEEECSQFLEEAVTEFEQKYLGTNKTADWISNDLVFPVNLCDGMVQATYESNAPEIVWEDGTVDLQSVSEAGEVVAIRVSMSCQEMQLHYVCYVNVRPPLQTEEEKQKEKLESLLQDLEIDTRTEQIFILPKTIEGEAVKWKKEPQSQIGIIVLLGVAAGICVIYKPKQDEKKKKLQREKTLEKEYPQMVTQLATLMGAGMPLQTAWERMVRRYLEEQKKGASGSGAHLYVSEMLVTYREIKEGQNIRRAYADFGNRIGLAKYRKLSAILLQNLEKGTRDIVHLLDVEAEMALDEQKQHIRKLGEEAGTKLLFPMFLLFLMILIIVMVPAMQSF